MAAPAPSCGPSMAKTLSSNDASHVPLGADLKGPGRVRYDDPSVLRRLKVDPGIDEAAKACLVDFKNANKESIATLQTLERLADDTHKQELEMQAPLVELFRYVEEFQTLHEASQCRCRFINQKGNLKTVESLATGFPHLRPDFTGAAVEVKEGQEFVHNLDFFVEIKASTSQGPKTSSKKSTKDSTLPSLLTQSANYGRVFTSYRPFQLFSVGLLIFGRQFCAGIYDRGGVILSPIQDMWKDTLVFISLIRSLTHRLDDVDLGFDPTVTRVPRSVGIPGLSLVNMEFPTFVVDRIGDDQRTFITIGSQISVSPSLIGRGTNVWKIRPAEFYDSSGNVIFDVHLFFKNLQDKAAAVRVKPLNLFFILKNTWRSSHRYSESWIYEAIRTLPGGGHPALATFVAGDDVFYDRRDQGNENPPPITVRSLRGESMDPEKPDEDEEETPVLHRLLLSTVGRPLWDYHDDLELVEGINSALSAHEWLCDHGILHRDMSAANIMLAENPDAPGVAKGFLMDLEFAYLPDNIQAALVKRLKVVHPRTQEVMTREHRKFVSPRRGAPITGTMQFMAIEILKAIIEEKVVPHEPKHDLESIHWIFGYCVLRKFVGLAIQGVQSAKLRGDESELKKAKNVYDELNKEFVQAFGRLSVSDILASRKKQGPLSWVGYDTFDDIVQSAGMTQPFYALLGRMKMNLELRDWEGRPLGLGLFQKHTPLTHEFLMQALQDTAAAIRAQQ